MSCLLITLNKCLKGHKSLGSLCSVLKTLIVTNNVSGVRQTKQARDRQCHLLSCQVTAKNKQRKINPTKQTFSITQRPIGPSGFCQKLPTGRWSFQIYFKFHFNDIKLSLRYEKCDTINGTTDYLDLALSSAFSFSPYFWPPAQRRALWVGWRPPEPQVPKAGPEGGGQ